MSTLQEFLNSNPVDNLTDEVAISERFKDKDGTLFKFKIKAMDGDRFEEIRKRAMTVKAKGRKGTVELDMQKFNGSIVIEHTLVPDFKDAESIKKTRCFNPEQYLKKVLLPGEIDELSGRIQKLSGFDQDISDANYAYYVLHKFHKWPSEFLALSREEKAFVAACIDERLAAEKKAESKLK